ncbi:hypothetical protein M406DRAFT_357809 [Cryphonectria parasitica EP155]|uniref:Uncharacterized protein n=1 Tax=Cryphonectria parasitica (strain ATCC 38755 / EP155) TaxID=660469 RepID=A0A9P4XVF1_CRYP1|nr:uncharacterized protein M406DRAFT_357809 [Cryphonectria parasitica EP155]KAF3761633.1 hypothetical protein M406DRAFT_357809 [Cryphonectria parasitica EP155]
MPFNFSFSSSVTFVSTTSGNGGDPRGWAYRREAYSNNAGSGVRTTQQNLGEAPVMQTRMYDAQGRPLLTSGDGSDGRRAGNPHGMTRRIISIEDVTEVDEAGNTASTSQQHQQQQNNAGNQ